MTKYGRRLRFGYCPIPTAEDPSRPLRLATMAETLGLDCIGIQDHPYNAAHHDAWTLLAAIGMATTHISLFTNVAELSLRSPALLAKAAASLDLLTNGRVEVGLGGIGLGGVDTGAAWDSLVAMGGEKRSDQETPAMLEEAIQVMRLMWGGERTVHFEGRFYRLGGLHSGPAPAHRIGIWLGVNNEPHLSTLAGRLADGWIPAPYPVIQPDDLVMLSKHVDDAAVSVGREPSDIQRIWNITGAIGNEESNTHFQGTANQWAESLAELAVDIGIDTFLLMEGENGEEQLRKFAREVVPHTKKLLEVAPGVAVSSGLSRAYQGAAASGATVAEEKTDDVDRVDEASMESFPASDPPASSSAT